MAKLAKQLIKENKMSKFKVGDRVRVGATGGSGHATPGDVGTILPNELVRWDDPAGCTYPYGCSIEHSKLIFANPSLDNLSIDDVVVSDEGNEYTVAAVIGRVVIIENEAGHEDGIFTVKELKDNDWTVKSAESEITEMTLEEVAKLKGIPVEQLRIKE